MTNSDGGCDAKVKNNKGATCELKENPTRGLGGKLKTTELERGDQKESKGGTSGVKTIGGRGYGQTAKGFPTSFRNDHGGENSAKLFVSHDHSL